MSKLKALSDSLKRKAANQERDLLAIIKDNEQEILDLIREQMMNGLDGNGESLGKYKSESYAIMKELYNPKRVKDYRLTGAFHEAMYLDCSQFPITVWSTDEKTEKIISIAGEDLFKLSEASKDKVPSPKLFRAFQEYYKKVFQV